MTASEVAQMLNAKRVKKGEWIAKCPSHEDHHPSLSIKEGTRGVLLYCQSAHCTLKEITAAMGIKISDLFYSSRLEPEVALALRNRMALDRTERREALLMWLEALNPTSRYYRAAVRGVKSDLLRLRMLVEPKKTTAIVRMVLAKRRLNRYGFDKMWERYLATPQGQADARKYERELTV
jgi:hypothetical protein